MRISKLPIIFTRFIVLKKEMKNYFSPEFLNRIDDTIVFNSLNEDSIKQIVNIELTKLIKRLGELKLVFKFDLLFFLWYLLFFSRGNPIFLQVADETNEILTLSLFHERWIFGILKLLLKRWVYFKKFWADSVERNFWSFIFLFFSNF